MTNVRRRLDRLEAQLAAGPTDGDGRRPIVTFVISCTRDWRRDSNEDGADMRGEQERRQSAMVAEIADWATADARKHNYMLPYTLVVRLAHDAFEEAWFSVPWRGIHMMQWPLASSGGGGGEVPNPGER